MRSPSSASSTVSSLWPGGPAPFGTIEFGFNYHPGGSMMAASSAPFQGLYMGTFAGYAFGAPNQFELGVQVGFNHSLGRFVVGTEVATYYSLGSGPFINAELNARLGANFGNCPLSLPMARPASARSLPPHIGVRAAVSSLRSAAATYRCSPRPKPCSRLAAVATSQRASTPASTSLPVTRTTESEATLAPLRRGLFSWR